MYRNFRAAVVTKLLSAATVLVFALPQGLAAQDCGSECKSCGTNKREGYSHVEKGQYFMDCVVATTGCQACGETMISDAATAPAKILHTLRSASPQALAKLAPSLKDKLLLHQGRGIVAVRGVKCDSSKVTALTFLSPERIEILRRSGLPRLEDFLAKVEAQAK
jgi:hypothetical protein